MSYTKRLDGRKFDELRPIELKVGIIKRADGSALFKIGKTTAIAAVYGPRALHPTFMRNPTKGLLRCNYNLMAFAGSGERVRPGPSRRSKEISLVTEKALLPVIDLSQFPNTVVDVFIELTESDAGTRCAGITAASMALADAGFDMKELISSISVGIIDNKVVIDITKEEEDYKDGCADIPLAFTSRTNKLTLLQMDGSINKEFLKEIFKIGSEACKRITELQIKAIKEKYSEVAKDDI